MDLIIAVVWIGLVLLVPFAFSAAFAREYHRDPATGYRGSHRAPVDWRQLAVTTLAVAVSCWAGLARWLANNWTAYAKSHVWRTTP